MSTGEIFKKAMELGKLIKEDERIQTLEEAKKAYDMDETIGTLTVEYEVQQKALAAAYGETERDQELIDAINARINEIYEKVIATDTYKAYESAQTRVNELMQQVNATIQYEVSGETACTHDCSTCSGCH